MVESEPRPRDLTLVSLLFALQFHYFLVVEALQEKMFHILGFTPERAMAQFGFLINAFKYGAPPHAGLAFGLDRLVSIFAGLNSIRDCIAFPKNNSGRDVMLDAPSTIAAQQLDELCLKVDLHQ